MPSSSVVPTGASGSWQYVPSPDTAQTTQLFMVQDDSNDHYLMQDKKEFKMDCWTTLSFEQWRLKNHPDHIPVPEMPTSINPDQSQESETLLQYKPAIYASDEPVTKALLGDAQRSSTKLPNRNSLLLDLGSRINLIGRNTAQ